MVRLRGRSPEELTAAGIFVVVFVLALASAIPKVAVLPFAVVVGGLQLRDTWRSTKPRRPPKFDLFRLASGLILGRDANDGGAVVLSDEQLNLHSVILGATGSGKTTTLLTTLTDAIARGLPVVAIDLKGSDSFAAELQAAATQVGRPFHLWRLDGPGHWNPLAHGDPTELKDKLISFERFSEPHYQRAAERYLQRAIQVLRQVDPDNPVTLGRVVTLLDPPRLMELLKWAPPDMAGSVGSYLNELTRDQKSAVMGLQSRLALLVESTPGQYLQPGQPQIDLYHALAGGSEVVCFSLNSSRYGKLAPQIAALVIQDIITVAGYRLSMPNRPLALVAIDECSALDADNLSSLLARGRESGIGVMLSTQELIDLERLGPGFRDQVMGIAGTTIAHRQTVPDSAEFIARMVGTHTVWKYTHTVTRGRNFGELFLGQEYRKPVNVGSKREVEEFRIHPNTIRELPTGRAVLITRTPVASACVVDVIAGPRPLQRDGD